MQEQVDKNSGWIFMYRYRPVQVQVQIQVQVQVIQAGANTGTGRYRDILMQAWTVMDRYRQ